jgi:hypothetical protein
MARPGRPAPISGAGAPFAQPLPTFLPFEPQLAKEGPGIIAKAAAKAIAGKIWKAIFIDLILRPVSATNYKNVHQKIVFGQMVVSPFNYRGGFHLTGFLGVLIVVWTIMSDYPVYV